MAKRDYIITAFALQQLRINAYEGKLGEQASTNASGDFPTFEDEPLTRLNVAGEDVDRLNWMGLPVWADLILKKNNEEDGILIDTLLLEVSMSKNIVKTPVSGRNGTVKEYINDGDFIINAKGLFAAQNAGEYPLNEVQEFKDKMLHEGSLVVVSPYLQLFNIYEIVIDDFKMPQQEGFQNVQLFEFNASSDVPIELIDEGEDV